MKKLYLLLLFISTASLAQETYFKGIIQADSIAHTQVNIVNLTQELGTVNNPSGSFSINAEIGDEVIFSSVQYEPYQITVTEEVLTKEKNLIYLFPAVNELDEVNISNIDLTGDLANDAGNIPTEVFDPRDHGLPLPAKRLTTAQRRLYTASSSAGGLVPLDPLINLITGRMAMLKKLREYEKQDRLKEIGLHSRSIDYFVKDLGIPEEYVEDFIYFCGTFKPFRGLLVKKERTFELSEFFVEKAEAYKKLRGWKE